ncbi:hypothetical protein DN069_20305 [Streptacidiphilus pinicola]|uniref:Uncharacterized protein n=1 Tax=Streptacidiphilus pinicola TaxID=2219663 RepID=A0A2X0K3E9_9ACTN|nr:hypothetical protein [Streptacidiphilus pinicola]RAG83785.1 hypothetical protein DN069_20305 [Streptacidiphilus pinicola]
MDELKIDADLLEALEALPDASEQRLAVFIHLADEPTSEERELLAHVGAAMLPASSTTTYAMMTPRDVRALSEEPWVFALTLSTPVHPLASSSWLD